VARCYLAQGRDGPGADWHRKAAARRESAPRRQVGEARHGSGDRLEAALGAGFVEPRGLPALAVGRGMPGLRTLTVVAAGASGLSKRRALPALILGSSVFLQLHLVLGLLLGPLADRAFNQAKGPTIGILAVVVIGALVFWRTRRGKREAAEAWAEAACPACIGLSLLGGQMPVLAGLDTPDPPDSRSDDRRAAIRTGPNGP